MKVWEVGVGEGCQSRTDEFIDSDVECYLFEPNPISFKEIEEKFKDQGNFKLFNFALGSENKVVDFYLAKGSSFIDGYHSPELCGNPNAKSEKEKVQVRLKDIKDIDEGDIDILYVDTEGSEYDIIKSMSSRPDKIVVEMFSHGVGYKNPYFNEINEWMISNDYNLMSEDEDYEFVRI